MDRFWPWHHFWSYHLLDWIHLLTQNMEIHGFWWNPFGRVVGHSWQRPFFSQNNTSLEFWRSFRWFPDFPNSKKTPNLTKPGDPKYEPVMFDMDPFGGKKVPCTKYQESGITACGTDGMMALSDSPSLVHATPWAINWCSLWVAPPLQWLQQWHCLV